MVSVYHLLSFLFALLAVVTSITTPTPIKNVDGWIRVAPLITTGILDDAATDGKGTMVMVKSADCNDAGLLQVSYDSGNSWPLRRIFPTKYYSPCTEGPPARALWTPSGFLVVVSILNQDQNMRQAYSLSSKDGKAWSKPTLLSGFSGDVVYLTATNKYYSPLWQQRLYNKVYPQKYYASSDGIQWELITVPNRIIPGAMMQPFHLHMFGGDKSPLFMNTVNKTLIYSTDGLHWTDISVASVCPIPIYLKPTVAADGSLLVLCETTDYGDWAIFRNPSFKNSNGWKSVTTWKNDFPGYVTCLPTKPICLAKKPIGGYNTVPLQSTDNGKTWESGYPNGVEGGKNFAWGASGDYFFEFTWYGNAKWTTDFKTYDTLPGSLDGEPLQMMSFQNGFVAFTQHSMYYTADASMYKRVYTLPKPNNPLDNQQITSIHTDSVNDVWLIGYISANTQKWIWQPISMDGKFTIYTAVPQPGAEYPGGLDYVLPNGDWLLWTLQPNDPGPSTVSEMFMYSPKTKKWSIVSFLHESHFHKFQVLYISDVGQNGANKNVGMACEVSDANPSLPSYYPCWLVDITIHYTKATGNHSMVMTPIYKVYESKFDGTYEAPYGHVWSLNDAQVTIASASPYSGLIGQEQISFSGGKFVNSSVYFQGEFQTIVYLEHGFPCIPNSNTLCHYAVTVNVDGLGSPLFTSVDAKTWVNASKVLQPTKNQFDPIDVQFVTSTPKQFVLLSRGILYAASRTR